MTSRIGIPYASDRILRSLAQDDGIGRLRYAKGTRRDALEHLGIHTVRDILLHLPSRYLDLTTLTPIEQTEIGNLATVRATVDRINFKQPRPRLTIVEVYVVDETGVMRVSFFRQPWIKDQLKKGDTLLLQGKVTFNYGFKQMNSPFFENLGAEEAAAQPTKILPVYSVGEGITVAWMRRIISSAIMDYGDVVDFMPASYVAKHKLMSEGRALREVHFPESLYSAQQARRRLAYDELLLWQLTLLTRRSLELKGIRPTQHVIDGLKLKALRKALPFKLTDEQEEAGKEILTDMASSTVMNRLLLGDVGTGKTAVAALALGAVADSGTQAAVMAPTSVLAHQYAEKLGPVLDKAKIPWVLITGATPQAERAESTQGIAEGAITVVFGTAAILSENLEFDHLTLEIVDEQHRFGVGQRVLLRSKGVGVDMLTMSATPIPRTLALSVYGDLSVSRITKRPVRGAGIKTKVITPENADIAFGAIRAAVAKGQQAYVVCPLVDESDEGDTLDEVPENVKSKVTKPHAAIPTYQRLKTEVFPNMRIGLLYGRMSAQQKDEVMEQFRTRQLDVIVSTTVIEVGVDVPNATVMLVLDADRFGLATLHQLRGRVGRGSVTGKVYLEAAAKKGTLARKRLSVLEKTSDGYELANMDLKLRHEGDLLGYRQSGGVTLKVADLENDEDLIKYAYVDAREIAAHDQALSEPLHALLGFEMRSRFGAYFKEVEHV